MRIAIAAVVVIAVTGCRRGEPGVDCGLLDLSAGGDAICTVPGHPGRDFLLHLPESVEGPPILALHGGGGRKEGFDALTCPGGDEASPDCFIARAVAAGHPVLVPDGVANALGFRSWNQGGDGPGLHCPHACAQGVDDVAYLESVLAEARRVSGIDIARVLVTGFSNGAGMAHRLACERSERVAAIAPVGGGNQHVLTRPCAPSQAVAVLQIHGEDDPCWPLDGGEGDCLAAQRGRYAGVIDSIIGPDGWAVRLGCDEDVTVTTLPDLDGDGQQTEVHRFDGCAAPLRMKLVRGGGHTWPGGHQYLAESRIGSLSEDFSATESILDFFASASTGPRGLELPDAD